MKYSTPSRSFAPKVFFTMVFLLCFGFSSAQETGLPSKTENTHFFKAGMDYSLNAFFSIGGSSPLSVPREIRAVLGYNPGLQLGLELNATKWFETGKWGVRAGIGVDGKGMKTKAQVKNYRTEIRQGKSEVKGYFTGKVETRVKNTYATLPVSAVYKLSGHWNLYAGLYAAFLIDSQFSGDVSQGYLRQGTPTGPKITFEDGSSAHYDFSDKERIFQWGGQVGGEYRLDDHLKLFSNLSFGVSNIFKRDFHSISFGMHNIYLNTGFGYVF